MKLFKRLLDFLNIHSDKNQRWTLSTLFIVGLLDAYVGPAISKAWVTELPAEWLAFQSLVYSVVGLFIGMIWKGWVRRKAIQWFTVLCIIESAAGFCVGMWLCFVDYNAAQTPADPDTDTDNPGEGDGNGGSGDLEG
jgi:uncharacterized membrane protein YeaQ/YmgE (transglycosylase-associated protein family)